ncbi:MAG TPA: DUF3307 domain-containing protein [Cyclobacteriaceae bacterium]|nr:DUF3307 domain-containing protein [Cyclobacteriaceae bacterium]
MILFVKLFLVHLLVDFVFQTDQWVKDKELKKHKSPKLYLHVLLHGLLSMAIVWEINFWPYALGIAISHLFIDWCKLTFQTNNNQKIWFGVDQISHVAILLLVTVMCKQQEIDYSAFALYQESVWTILAAVVFLSFPTSVLIRILISGWTPKTEDKPKESLENAGKYIGVLERLFVLTFILTDHWEGIGFLLAAKSIFRFGDLKESKERKLTEYVMIGTLLSFGLALLTGLLVLMSITS